jgi:hypothetical protein
MIFGYMVVQRLLVLVRISAACPIQLAASTPTFSTPQPIRSTSSTTTAPVLPPLSTTAAGWAQNSRMSNDRHSRPTAQNDSLRPAPLWEASTWGPYFDALFPPQEVSTWISWKMTSTGTNIARRLWDEREQLRGEYEDVHGTDRALWPVQHPGVVLDAVLSSAHGACLGCQWFDVQGHSMHHSDCSNEPLYGRTDTKSPMVYSSMVHVAGGEEGSIRHDNDGRPAPSGGSPGIGGMVGSR